MASADPRRRTPTIAQPRHAARTRLRAWVDAPGEGQFVAACLGVAVLLRAAAVVAAVQHGWTYMDLDEMCIARALLEGRGFAFDYYGLFGSAAVPGAFFPPAYVYNVYALERFFGSDAAVFVQNAVFSVGVSLCLYALGRRAFGRLPARVVLLLSVFYVPFFSRLTHGSPVYFKMILICLLVLTFHRARELDSRPGYLLAGALGGLLTLAMPDVLAYLGLLGVLLLARAGTRSCRVVRVVLFLGTAALVVAPWTIRNWRSFHRFCLVSSNGGMNFYMGNNASTTHQVAGKQEILQLDERLGGELARGDEFERDAVFYREGLRYVREQPVRVALNMLARGFMHWTFRPGFLAATAPGAAENAGGPGLYVWSYVLCYAPLLPLCAWGVWLERRRWRELAPILMTFAYSTLVTMLFVVQTKQRLIKVEPFMLLFAAAALANWLEVARRPLRG